MYLDGGPACASSKRLTSFVLYAGALFIVGCSDTVINEQQFWLGYSLELAAGTSPGTAEAIQVGFAVGDAITEGFPSELGHPGWRREPLSDLDKGVHNFILAGPPMRRTTQWRGYARLAPPDGDQTPIVGDIVDVVYDDNHCNDDVCYSATTHFVLGRVLVP